VSQRTPPRRFRALFVSDIHLGHKACQADQLLDFLRHHSADTIFLVGDIIDGWELRSRPFWPKQHDEVVRQLFLAALSGTRIVYVPGNHDDALRGYCGARGSNIEVVERAIHITADGRRYLVAHGDCFDVVARRAPWLAMLGARLYNAAIAANGVFNEARRLLGLSYWSISLWAKLKVKEAVNYISEYEAELSAEAERFAADGIICGHIHCATSHDEFGVHYVNCGDWVESCTAVAEHHDGRLEVIAWTDRARGVAVARGVGRVVPAPALAKVRYDR
jgi:UDP-2,3-diacylglucosamine pyrophosphatase LpxH